MKQTIKHGLLALTISTLLAGCALDGDDGSNGTNGTDGTNGINGVDGTNGENGKNAPTSMTATVVGRFVTAAEDKEGAAEIVQYHADTQLIYAINSSTDQPVLEIIDASTLSAVSDPLNDTSLTSTTFALPTSATIGDEDRALSDANSIAISGDLLAVAMAADEKALNGVVVFYNIATGTPQIIKTVEVGNLPDMVTFTPDGLMALVANEGEPSDDYQIDPEGSVSLIEIVDTMPADDATPIGFSEFNDQQAQLEARGVRFSNPGGSSVAQDLEPEYISATNAYAYVTMQENNAIAKIDLSDRSVQILPLGVKDWSQYSIDVSNKDGISFNSYPGLYGMYMPDTIASFNWNGAVFVVTANEGDAREYIFDADDEASCLAAGGMDFDDGDCFSYIDEVRVKDLDLDPNAAFAINYDKDVLGRLKVTPIHGDIDDDGEYEELYAFGARSFSIWDSNGLQVFDSGDDFGRITAAIHGDAFNNNEDENEGDSRSDDKGGEPEALAIGEIDGRTYAFIGLERMGGIFVYDVTNPYNVSFVDYFINRDTTEGLSGTDIQGDLAPEGMKFIAADHSPTGEPLLVVGNEISGSVTIWELKPE